MSELGASPTAIGLIVLRTVVVYLFVMVGLRLRGKREIGQLAPVDFALILLIANAVQNAMVGPDSSLAGGLAAAGSLLLLNWGFGWLSLRNRRFGELLRGKPRVLVSRGHVFAGSLRAEGLSHQDLMQALRESGCATVEECRLAVMEVDGSVSVIGQKG